LCPSRKEIEMPSEQIIPWITAAIGWIAAVIYFIQYLTMKRQLDVMKRQAKVMADDNDVNYTATLFDILLRTSKWDVCRNDFHEFLDKINFFDADKDAPPAVNDAMKRIRKNLMGQQEQ
jgi:hypothetical protein